jgi:hypothetical protein
VVKDDTNEASHATNRKIAFRQISALKIERILNSAQGRKKYLKNEPIAFCCQPFQIVARFWRIE